MSIFTVSQRLDISEARRTARSVLSLVKVSTLTPCDNGQDDGTGEDSEGDDPPPVKRKKLDAL